MEGFFDIHCHILPSTDDGASCLEESLELLSMMSDDGVGYAAATPHFYAEKMSFDDYVRFTDERFELLKSKYDGRIELVKGFEVRYFSGISLHDDIRQLTIGGSDYILIEFPYNVPITDKTVREIENIYYNFNITPVLAHIERYVKYRGFDSALSLVEDGVAMAHINASSMFDRNKDAALWLIDSGIASLVASDAHSADRRPPIISDALNVISEECGEETAKKLTENSQRIYREISG